MQALACGAAMAALLVAPALAAGHRPGSPFNPTAGDRWQKAAHMEADDTTPESDLYVNAAVPASSDRHRLPVRAWIVFDYPADLGRRQVTEAEIFLLIDCVGRRTDPAPKMIGYDARGRAVYREGGTSDPAAPLVPIVPETLEAMAAMVVCTQG